MVLLPTELAVVLRRHLEKFVPAVGGELAASLLEFLQFGGSEWVEMYGDSPDSDYSQQLS